VIIKIIYIGCDFCQENIGHDTHNENVFSLRESAKSNGWKRKKMNGIIRDVCPECLERWKNGEGYSLLRRA
jgi:hypothetical protein